jgi:hypothetical protein
MSENNGVVTKNNFASAWKKQTMTVKFPSGNLAEVTRPNVLSLLSESGDAPDEFLGILMATTKEEAEAAASALTLSKRLEYASFVETTAERLICAHFVNPLVVEGSTPNYDEGEISKGDVKAMDAQDKQFFLNFGMYGGEPVDALKRFLEQQAKLLAAAQNGQGV